MECQNRRTSNISVEEGLTLTVILLLSFLYMMCGANMVLMKYADSVASDQSVQSATGVKLMDVN